MYEYEMKIDLSAKIGHMAASRLRDSIEEMTQGAVANNEEISAELVSASQILLHVKAPEEIGEQASVGIRDAINDALSGALDVDAGETANVGDFVMKSYPATTPSP